MSTLVFFILLTLGLSVMFLLLWIISTLLKKEKLRVEVLSDARLQQKQAREKMVESIQILLKVVGSEELGWIETSIRVKKLLDQLSFDLSNHKTINVFYKVYSETEHIPTHAAWADLPKESKNKYRKVFLKCEERYLSQLEEAKTDLLNYLSAQ